MQEEGRFRKKQGFTMTPNTVVNDTSLSMGAIGLYTKIQYFITIPDFTLYKSVLIKKCKEGRKAFDSRWEELKRTGYLKVYRTRSERNNQFMYEFELLDTPDCSTPAVNNVAKDGELKDQSHTPHFGCGGEWIPSKDKELQDGISINNNLINNTILKNNLSIHQDGRNEIEQQEACWLLIEQNVEYDSIVGMEQLHIGEEVLNGWISMMVNTIFSKADKFVINQHPVYKTVLASEFKKVKRQHLLYAIQKYRSVNEEIKNPEAYMRACLWSAIHNQEVVSDHAMVRMGVY